jgi:hypothetical protein
MLKRFFKQVSDLSVGKKAVIGVATFLAVSVMGAAAQPGPRQNLTPPTPSPTPVLADKIEKKVITDTQTIPYKQTSVQDNSLDQGKTSVKTNGVNGTKSFTYEITLTNGVETAKKLIKEEVTTSPVDEVDLIGTKAPQPVVNCPNGSYTNTSGNKVCSPYQNPSAPNGASARCRDGTYSFSQSRSGTCSHHGGVAEWL